jgi:hypothetical protein
MKVIKWNTKLFCCIVTIGNYKVLNKLRTELQMTEREQAIKALSSTLCEMLINILDTQLRSCLNCTRFELEREVCILYDQRPPARIIAKACERWESLELPF